MFETHLIATMSAIPSLFGSFAAALGMDVDSSNVDAPKVRAFTGGVQFRVKTTSNDLIIEQVADATITSNAFCRAPTINNAVVAPTAVTFIGGLTPEPYIGVVINFGDNLFRHLYFGYMEKVGDYTGGEVISSSQAPLVQVNGDIGYRDSNACHYLFQGRQFVFAAANAGGVNVIHADNPTSWRKFLGPNGGSAMSGFTTDHLIGGFTDDINDGYLARARSPFAGVNPLVPVNLYMPVPISGDVSFRPIGCPAGVRLVNMQDLTPGATIDIGSDTWHCFPAFARSLATVMPKGTGNWRASETSFMVGYAYLEG